MSGAPTGELYRYIAENKTPTVRMIIAINGFFKWLKKLILRSFLTTKIITAPISKKNI